MRKIWNYDSIKAFVSENSDCELLSADFNSTNEKLDFKCLCGVEFSESFNQFKSGYKRQCTDCGKKKESNQTYRIVKKFIEDNSTSKLVDESYQGLHDDLQLRCECGTEFQTTFNCFSQGLQRQCSSCN